MVVVNDQLMVVISDQFMVVVNHGKSVNASGQWKMKDGEPTKNEDEPTN